MQHGDHVQKVSVVTASIERLMEATVARGDGRFIAERRLVLITKIRQDRDFHIGCVLGRKTRGRTLEDLAHIIELRDHAVVEFGHHDAARRVVRHQTLGLQPAQGLPNRSAAQPDLLRQLDLTQPLARA